MLVAREACFPKIFCQEGCYLSRTLLPRSFLLRKDSKKFSLKKFAFQGACFPKIILPKKFVTRKTCFLRNTNVSSACLSRIDQHLVSQKTHWEVPCTKKLASQRVCFQNTKLQEFLCSFRCKCGENIGSRQLLQLPKKPIVSRIDHIGRIHPRSLLPGKTCLPRSPLSQKFVSQVDNLPECQLLKEPCFPRSSHHKKFTSWKACSWGIY